MKDNRGFINYKCSGVICAALPAKERQLTRRPDIICENCYYVEMTGKKPTAESSAQNG